ncbi:heme transporter hrg1-A-like [Arctopsyche grandis]|uniref:heme transporter hrg1-A-like n=1 Tax=Arctopsyche grandis TaxID=121162 RepID=UPI00406DA4D7
MALCCRNVWCYMFFSFIGIILGISSFICFTFVFYNYYAGVMGFYSGVLALMVFHLHRLHAKDVLRDWYSVDIFSNIEFFALIGMMIGLATTLWFIFVQLYYEPPIMPIQTSAAITTVWTFMTFKWGLILFFTSKKYSRSLEEIHLVLTNSENA